MRRLPSRFAMTVAALCAFAQGGVLWRTGRGPAALPPTAGGALGVLAAVCVVALAVALRRSGRRRAATGAALVSQALLVIVVAVVSLAPRPDDATWIKREQERARQHLTHEAAAVRALPAALDRAAAAFQADCPADSALLADPFGAVVDWSRRWAGFGAEAERYPLALALWHGDERVGWRRGVALTDAPPAPGARDVVRDESRWFWRQGVALPVGDAWRLELQVALAPVDEMSGGDQRSGTIARSRRVVNVDQPAAAPLQGDARRGLLVTTTVDLGEGGAQAYRLQLRARVPARTVFSDRLHAVLILVCAFLVGAAALAIGGALGGGLGLLAAAWVVRWLWASVDAVRWWTAAFPGQRLPALPTEPASLVDPAYFATTFAKGWFASGADAMLTALLAVLTLAVVLRHPPARDSSPSRPWRGELAAVGVAAVAAAGLFLLRTLAHQFTANANARLLGLQVPYDSWTFWALHAALFLTAVTVVGLTARLAAIPARRGGSRRRLVLHAVVAGIPIGVLWLAFVPGAPVEAAVAAFVVALVVAGGYRWWTPGRPGRLVWGAVALLVVVSWNYLVLADAYGVTEREWLRRKADEIVQPQGDWIAFLLEDVLTEMAAADSTASARTDAPAAPEPEGIWRNAAAYRLWRASAVRDLGLPCLVEVRDADDEEQSVYAVGFLRDYGYEVIERSGWGSLPDSSGGRGHVLMQDERRRYPTGEEHVLRGEIPRHDGSGWLRVELPVQSRRLSTLLASLGAGPPTGDAGAGYQPRQEVDRPLLLLRGDSDGWLDVGFGGFPAAASRPVLEALQRGAREWGVVDYDRAHWLCRWAALPPSLQASPGEGFLIGLQRPGAVAVLLDWARLVLLDVLLVLAFLVLRAAARRRLQWPGGFQGKFLAGYLGIGIVLLLLAGWLADRLTFERLDRDARDRTRDGLVTTIEQLRGLLAEQARALAASDYIADMLVGRLGGERPQGPYSARQGMVFAPDGSLLLDETLSDLDDQEAGALLAAARRTTLVITEQGGERYLGTVIPIDLTAVMPDSGRDATQGNGTFFYRQRVDESLLAALADVVGGELTLRIDGEAVAASHPGRLFANEAPLLASPRLMRWLLRHPATPYVFPESAGLAFTGGLALPDLVEGTDSTLRQRRLPAVLAVDFPDRSREFLGQRRRTALFLAGLTTLLLLTALALAAALTWNIFEPLRVLLRATQRLAAGDYAAPLPAPGRDEVGRLAGGFHTMRDELRRARENLEARERFLAAVLERVPVGVVVWDAEGRLVTLNPAAEGILTAFYGSLPDLTAAHAAECLRRELRGKGHDHAGIDDLGPEPEVELSSGGGRRTLRVRHAPLALGGVQPHTLVVCEDLSEFLATKKLALNAELARQVAHEIKNPLTPIQLSAQLLQQAFQDRHPQLDAIAHDALARILEQVTLLRSIAGEFSLLGRPGELECSDLDLRALVVDALGAYRQAGAGGGPAISVAPATLPLVRGHRESLLKVLGNLMQNSLDASGGPEGLVLDVSWRTWPDAVALLWRDNGEGVAPDVAERLFDPYFSTKSKGTGLGLAICRNLLDKMGGRIALANREDGQGALVTLTLARADAPTEVAAPQEPPWHEPSDPEPSS